MRGFFITFEGMEGAGKSTQAQLLAGKLREKGYKIVTTREPGGTRIGEQIRKITHDPENVDLSDEAEAYLMAAARAQHVREIIVPELTRGKIVVCDRFIDSSLAYQGYGRGLGVDMVWELNRLALSSLVLPDLTILIQVDYKKGIRRRNTSYKVDRLDLQQEEFYGRVEKGYNELVRKYKERIVEVDGNGTIERVFEEVWRIVSTKLDS